jgi:NAD(P)-dependent dehydrogenase (short-subunit alcohol dehydrogenase family)
MRRILVTGSNKGIGLAIATAILDEHDDTFVLLASRDAARGRVAIDRLVSEHPGSADRVALIELDVASEASVAAAARGGRPPRASASATAASRRRSTPSSTTRASAFRRGTSRRC